VGAYVTTHEPEDPCLLIFTFTNTGDGIVLLYPHSSSNRSVRSGHFILQRFNSPGEVLKGMKNGDTDELVKQFLRLHAISCYGAQMRPNDAQFLHTLTQKTWKLKSKFPSVADEQLDRHRTQSALKASLLAGLIVALGQAASNGFGKESNIWTSVVLAALLAAALWRWRDH
jgi:hypothetical protein